MSEENKDIVVTGETVELSNDNLTICPHCCYSIEIILINENNSTIEYKCLKDNKKYTQTINEYLENIKERRIKNINELKYCKDHLNNFMSYCFECKKHLCDKCLKSRKHINHKKSNIIEIQPIKKELDIIKKVINDYKNEIKNLEKEEKKTKENLKKWLNKGKDEEKKEFKIKLESNNEKKDEDLKANKIFIWFRRYKKGIWK